MSQCVLPELSGQSGARVASQMGLNCVSGLHFLPSLKSAVLKMSLYELRPTLATREVGWMLGMSLGALCYGALLTLSISCIIHFHRTTSSTGGGFWTQHPIFQGYVVLVLLLDTVMQASVMEIMIRGVFYTNPDRITGLSWTFDNVLISTIIMVTDALMVSTLQHMLASIYTEIFCRFGGATWFKGQC